MDPTGPAMNLEIRNLDWLRRSRKTGSVTTRSTASISQESALRHQLRNVREQLGVALFERRKWQDDSDFGGRPAARNFRAGAPTELERQRSGLLRVAHGKDSRAKDPMTRR